MMKNTLVIGASENPERYSHKAIRMLRKQGYPVKAIGLKSGLVEDISFSPLRPSFNDIDTVTLYIGPRHQPDYYEYILGLKPNRIVFNPGTENEEFEQLAERQGIKVMEACTLVLLSTGQY